MFDKGKAQRSTETLQLIHRDICDDFSIKSWVYPLNNKSEIFVYFQEFKSMVENASSKSIRTLRSDNGGEFVKN